MVQKWIIFVGSKVTDLVLYQKFEVSLGQDSRKKKKKERELAAKSKSWWLLLQAKGALVKRRQMRATYPMMLQLEPRVFPSLSGQGLFGQAPAGPAAAPSQQLFSGSSIGVSVGQAPSKFRLAKAFLFATRSNSFFLFFLSC